MISQPQITWPVPILQPIVNFSKILFWISKHTLTPEHGISQVNIFNEDFSSYPDGTTSGTDWYTIVTDCDDPSPNQGLGISAFGVYGGQFTVNDSEGAPCCPLGGGGYENYLYTSIFNIDTLCKVFLEYQITYVGCECGIDIGMQPFPIFGCSGTTPPDNYTDQLVLEISLDGGPFQWLGATCVVQGGTSGIGTWANWGGTNSTLQARLSIGNNEDDDYIYLDFFTITGIPIENAVVAPLPILCENDPPFLLPSASQNGYQGTWNLGTTFDPMGHGGDSILAIFTPIDFPCVLEDSTYIHVLPFIQTTMNDIGPFCSDDQPIPLPLTSQNGIAGTWSGIGVNNNTFYPNQAGPGQPILTFTPAASPTFCSYPVTIPIVVGNAGPPILENAALCSTDTLFNLANLQDPDFPLGTWSGPGVNGSYFDPSVQYGTNILTFEPSQTCADAVSIFVFVVQASDIQLGDTVLCSSTPPISLTPFLDPLYPNGTWGGQGVMGNVFDPAGINGSVELSFTTNAYCTNIGTTSFYVEQASVPTLGTATICEDDGPLNLTSLADPNFPNGTWSGPGVTGNSFNPNGQSGNVTLSFSPSANACATVANTFVTVTAPGTPILGTSTLCQSDSPLDLVSLTDPVFPDGNWSGPGVTSNYFDPSEQNGIVTLTFLPSTSCAVPSTTSLMVNSLTNLSYQAIEDCNSTGQAYAITLNISGGTEPYFVDGALISGSSFSSPLLPSGTSYSFDLTDLIGCGIVNASGLVTCACTSTSSSVHPLLCQGEVLLVNGVTFSETNPSGSVVLPSANYLGCDSIVNVSLAFAPPAVGYLQQTLCSSQSLQVNGTVYDEANPNGVESFPGGSYIHCDSTLFIELTFQANDTTTFYTTTCIPGNEGIFVQNLTNQFGCDSTVLTTVTYLPGGDTTLLVSNTCDATNTGIFVQNLTGQDGCDSTIITTVSYYPSDTTYLFETSCNPSNIGLFYQNFLNIGGCDSTVVIAVTYSEADTSQLLEYTCVPGSTGVFTQNLVTPEGCDSLVITTIVLAPSNTTNLTQTTCDPALAGIFSQSYSNQFGCDSIVTITVALVSTDTVSIFSVTCDPTQTGVFTHNLTNQFGCDSLVIETVTQATTDTTVLYLETCLPLQVGTTTSILQNQLGCDSVVVTNTSLLPPEACATDFSLLSSPASCGEASGSISISVNLGLAPLVFEIWNGNSMVASGDIALIGQTTMVDNLSPGDYLVIVTSAVGISTNKNTSIAQVSSPLVQVTATSVFGSYELSCQGATDGSALAIGGSGTPPYEFVWSNGTEGDIATGLAAGVYSVTLTDANGCSDLGSIELEAPEDLEIMFTINDPDCFDVNSGRISVDVVGGVAPYSYSIDGIHFQTSNVFAGLPSNLYKIIVVDANGCEVMAIILINAAPSINVELGEDQTIELGEGATLNALINVPFESLTDITWSPAGSLECSDCLLQLAYPVVTTVYSIKVVDENGCSDEDDLTVFVDRRKQVYVPNGFSPNGDGINDLFIIYPKPGTVKKVHSFLIFSRWGETVYRYLDFLPSDPNVGWDGTHRGEKLDPGVFTWFAIIEFIDGSTELFKGDVTLVR